MAFTFEDPTTAETVRRIHALSEDLKRMAALKAPTIDDFLAAPILDGWRIAHRLEPALTGIVRGHPALGDGKVVTTSGLYILDPQLGYARTLSRWYRLGSRVDNAT